MKRMILLSIIVLIIFYTLPVLADDIDSLLDNSTTAFNEKRVEDGLVALDKASQSAEEKKDYAACLKVGLAYAKLPPELERKDYAIDILNKGADFAVEQQKWTILWNFADTLENLNANDEAIAIYDQLFLKAAQIKDKDTIFELKKRYEQLYSTERVEVCAKMIDALTVQPPTNWQPLGESVRGNKETPPDAVQQTQRQIADQQVQSAMEYFIEKRKLAAQKKVKPMPTGNL